MTAMETGYMTHLGCHPHGMIVSIREAILPTVFAFLTLMAMVYRRFLYILLKILMQAMPDFMR